MSVRVVPLQVLERRQRAGVCVWGRQGRELGAGEEAKGAIFLLFLLARNLSFERRHLI